MNSSNNNPSRQQQQGAGFRSGPIRNVGGGPPPLSSGGLAVNRTSAVGSSTARPNNTAPSLAAAPPPVPSAPRHSYDARPVQKQQQQQSYDPFSQQQQSNVSYNNTSNVNVALLSTPSFTPDNSAQLQPHIVSLPPSPGHSQPPPLQQTAVAPTFQHPLQPPSSSATPQQQQGIYQARSSTDHPAAELQRRFYPQHYNNQQQQQQVVSSNVFNHQPTPQQQQPNQTSYQVKSTPTTVSTSTSTQQQQQQVSSSTMMHNQPPTQQQKQKPPPPPIQRSKQPPKTPDEDLDQFLSTNLSDSASGMTYTRPKPLPPTSGVVSKSKLLAARRAWGDVIRVTNDALIVRNMDGGGGSDVGKHHSFYSEIVSAAMSSGPSSPSKTSSQSTTAAGSSSTDGKASSPNEIDEIQQLRRDTCELIVLRFIAHLKLRRYVDLGKEVSMLGLMPFLPDCSTRRDGISSLLGVADSGDNEDSATNDNNSNSNNDNPLSWKEGSLHSTEPKDKLPQWIPYGLRILAAQQLQYNDGSSKALDVLLDMRDRTVRTEYWNTRGMEVWTSTIDNAIVNACVRMKEWRLALHYLEELIDGLKDGVERELLWWCHQDDLVGSINEETRCQLRELITSAAYVEILSRQILILLQSGAVKAAETIQGDVRPHASKVEGIVFNGALSRIHREFALVRQVPVRERVNDGLILFAQFDYELAAKRFRRAMELQEKINTEAENNNNNDSSTLNNTDSAPSPPGYPSWKDLDSPTLGFDADPSLTVECINNLSLCLLYSGKMRAAVQEMETLIRKDPCENLTEGLAFNLCTLYELGSDGEECTRRKKRLQRVAKRFFLHDIGVESFRLS